MEYLGVRRVVQNDIIKYSHAKKKKNLQPITEWQLHLQRFAKGHMEYLRGTKLLTRLF